MKLERRLRKLGRMWVVSRIGLILLTVGYWYVTFPIFTVPGHFFIKILTALGSCGLAALNIAAYLETKKKVAEIKKEEK